MQSTSYNYITKKGGILKQGEYLYEIREVLYICRCASGPGFLIPSPVMVT